jgi:hypothetical protein
VFDSGERREFEVAAGAPRVQITRSALAGHARPHHRRPLDSLLFRRALPGSRRDGHHLF